jgi:hypothetical protein
MVAALDRIAVCKAVAPTGRLLLVDKVCEGFGLSGSWRQKCLRRASRLPMRGFVPRRPFPTPVALRRRCFPPGAYLHRGSEPDELAVPSNGGTPGCSGWKTEPRPEIGLQVSWATYPSRRDLPRRELAGQFCTGVWWAAW